MQPSWSNISDAIFHYASERPEAVAIVEGRETIDYRELARLVGNASVYLRDLGINPGDRVAACLTNSADHLILSFAAMRIGAALIEISPHASQPDREAMVRKYGISTFFSEPDAPVVGATKSLWLDIGWREQIARKDGDWRCPDGEKEPYVILLSSGSTGVPKGMVTTHRQYLARYLAAAELFRESEIVSPDRPANLLLTAEMNFTGFLIFVLFQVFAGGTVIVLPRYVWTADLARALAAWENSLCVVTPLVCRSLLAYARQRDLMFPKMRALIVVGQPLFAQEKRMVAERITRELYDVYGSAGCGILSALGPKDMLSRGNTVGRLIPFAEVEIVDRLGNKLPQGSTGHLRCRGAVISSGFYSESDSTSGAEGFRDGWFYPGDLAAIEEGGYLLLKGRSADLIVRRGIEIQPAEVEAVLSEHPSVAEAAVCGRPSPAIGEEVVALVVPRGESQHEELSQHLMGRLPQEKLPDRIIYAKSLPKTNTGKVNRQEVKAMAARHGTRTTIGMGSAQSVE
ncbi:MAG TPA: class I adenylate-forming enzyme family protein [Stellaceae bacterium]|nr:class I adenylate-forming enzyme family protein [Stellaceae bacterium]